MWLPCTISLVLCYLLVTTSSAHSLGVAQQRVSEINRDDVTVSLPTTTTLESMLFNMVQYLKPLPATWSPHIALEQWGNGVSAEGCPNTANLDLFYSIVLDPETFSLNRTVRLDLLDPTMPMCNVTTLPPLTASSPRMNVVIDFMQLPTVLQVLDISQADVLMASTLPFVRLPASITHLDLADTGIAGNLNFETIQYSNVSRRYVNVSGNEHVFGGVDLVNQAICDPNAFLIDLRRTNITLLVTETFSVNCIGQNSSSAGNEIGFPTAVFVDADVTMKTVDPSNMFPLDLGYYCMSPRVWSAFPTDAPMLNMVKQGDGVIMMKMINPPYECEFAFDVSYYPFVEFYEGYVLDSTAYGTQLSPCLNVSALYVQKMSTPGTQLGVVDKAGGISLFALCPRVLTNAHYSATLSDHAFIDVVVTPANVTAHGYQDSGVFTVCHFSWYLNSALGVGTQEVPQHTIYNDRVMLVHFDPCLPPAADNVTFGHWTSITLSTDENRIFFHDNIGNVLVLSKYQNSLVPQDTVYCAVTPTFLYRWNVMHFSSLITVHNSTTGEIVQTCTYDGILQQKQNQPQWNSVPQVNNFHAFDRIIDAIAPCLPKGPSGEMRRWNSTLSGVTEAASGGSRLNLVDDDNTVFVFRVNSCEFFEMTGSWCRSVDFFTGSVLLDVYPNRSSTLTYYRKSVDTPLQVVTTCTTNGVPLLIGTDGVAFLVDQLAEAWAPCLPRSTDVATFFPGSIVSLVVNVS
jgi:hypothetical protein